MKAGQDTLNNRVPEQMGLKPIIRQKPIAKRMRISKAVIQVICEDRDFCISIESGRTNSKGRIYTIAIREIVLGNLYSLTTWTYRSKNSVIENVVGENFVYWELETNELVPYEDWVIPYLEDDNDIAIFRHMERNCITCKDIGALSDVQLAFIRVKVEDKLRDML